MPLDESYLYATAILASANSGSSTSAAAPTDPTTAPSTAGSTGTYSEASVPTVTSSLDASITNLGYDRCHSLGHVGSKKLVPTLLFPGYQQNKTQFSQTLKRRMADYVGPTGLAPLVIAINSRGRVAGGTIDYVRDRQDRRDCLAHAVSTVGLSNVFGSGESCVVVGYSTGCLDALLYACTFPDRVLAVVLYYPNFDLGVDPADSYWALQDATQRSYMTSQIGDRAQGAVGALDPYLVRNPIDAIARIVNLPNAPHVWVMGDRTEYPGLPLPNPDRLIAALLAIPGNTGKIHIHITQSGDSNRILHDSGADGAGSIYAERYWATTVLTSTTEWLMPREAPSTGLRLLGWMCTRSTTTADNTARPGFEIWTGTVTAPKTNSAGGRLHVCEFRYWDTGRQFVFDPVTSQNGYLQVIRDADNRTYTLTAGTRLNVNLNVSATITDFADIGFAHDYKGGVGVTGTTQVTAWADQIGSSNFTQSAGTTCPSTATDANSKNVLRFSGASSQYLVLNSLLINPTADFTVCMVVSKTNTTGGYVFEASHHGSLAVCNVGYGSSVSNNNYKVDSGSYGYANTNGLGGQAFSQTTPHFIALMRKNGVFYMSFDGSSWSKSSVTADTFTLTGTNTTTIGCGWANGGGAFWQFWTGDVYEVATKNGATSEADITSAWSLMKMRWQF